MVCTRVLPYVTEMVIDEANKHITTNYTHIKNKVKAINSDHNTEFVTINLKVVPVKIVAKEMYNLKNLECQVKFKKLTEDTQDFSKVLNTSESVVLKCEKWKKTLDLHIKRAFKKVKVKYNKGRPSAANALIDKRNSLKNIPCNAQTKEALEIQIAEILLKEEVDKATHIKKFCIASGTFPLQQM